MESHNLDIVIFSEFIRKEMQSNNQPLIGFKRSFRDFFYKHMNVFSGCEAVTWGTKNLAIDESDDSEENNSDAKTSKFARQYLKEKQVSSLYQKLMDAGLLKNVTSQEEFKNDKSLFRFSSDDIKTERLVRAVAIGYRLFDSALCLDCKLFQRVCALGQLVSCECLKSSDIVDWLVNNGHCDTRETAVSLCQAMREFNVIKPVDSEVLKFSDSSEFYVFAIDYRRPRVSIQQFLSSKMVYDDQSSARNKRIHLRQTSDQLMDLSHMAISAPRNSQTSVRQKVVSTSSSESSSEEHGTVSVPSYKSLLNIDGSMTKEALMHPAAPFKKIDILIYPDAVGYGFVVRGSGPCYVKIVDPDSPAGKAGLKASQFITFINGTNVMELPHIAIEDLILGGPKRLKITVMQNKEQIEEKTKVHSKPPAHSSTPVSPVRQRSSPPLPSAQPWMKKPSGDYHPPSSGYGFESHRLHQVVTQ